MRGMHNHGMPDETPLHVMARSVTVVAVAHCWSCGGGHVATTIALASFEFFVIDVRLIVLIDHGHER